MSEHLLHHSVIIPVRIHCIMNEVADPGFSRGGDANYQKPIILSIFCQKLHENERIWTP